MVPKKKKQTGWGGEKGVGRGKRGKQGGGGVIRKFMSGSVLVSDNFTNRLPVIIMASVLVVVYMTVNFTIQRRYSYMQELRNQINELRTISVTTSSQRQRLTRKHSILELMEKYNIQLEMGEELPQIISPRN